MSSAALLFLSFTNYLFPSLLSSIAGSQKWWRRRRRWWSKELSSQYYLEEQFQNQSSRPAYIHELQEGLNMLLNTAIFVGHCNVWQVSKTLVGHYVLVLKVYTLVHAMPTRAPNHQHQVSLLHCLQLFCFFLCQRFAWRLDSVFCLKHGSQDMWKKVQL